MYEDASTDDLITILVGSLLLYKKEPVFVNAIKANRTIQIIDSKDKKEIISLNSVELDFSPVPLGMVQSPYSAYYLTRAPKRQYSQGLTKGNCYITDFSKTPGHLLTNIDIPSKEVISCIKGEYETLEVCLNNLRDEDKDIHCKAFSRSFAIDKDFNLYWKTNKVGMVDEDNGKFIFKRDRKYLKELINANR